MHLAMVSPFPPTLTGISQYGYYNSRSLVQTESFERISVLTNSAVFPAKGDIARQICLEQAWRPQDLRTAGKILRRLRSLSPDVVWFNLGASIFGSSILANLAGFFIPGMVRAMGYPTVVTLHELIELADLPALNAPGGSFARFGAGLLTRLAAQADVVCLTLAEYVKWFGLHHPGPKTVHIPIGAYQSPELLPESQPAYLLFFTSLAPFKGLEVLMEAFHVLRQHYPQLNLVVAGAPHPRFPAYTEALRKNHEQRPGVHWLGVVPQEEVKNLFAHAQMAVLPYKASTGSSSVLFQTAMWGRPVVASDLAGMRTAAAESGLEVGFFKNGDVASLIQAICRLLENPGLGRQQATNNLRAIQRHGPEQIARRYVKAFNLAIQNHCPEEGRPDLGDEFPGYGLGR